MSRFALPLLRPVLAVSLLFSAAAVQAATVVPITTDGQWFNFTVDPSSAANGLAHWIDTDYNAAAGNASYLSFSFTLTTAARLNVVDLYAAGDTYNVLISGGYGVSAGQTSAVAPQDLATAPFADTADAAWANPAFSRGSWVLGPGSYTVTGSLLQGVAGADGMTSGAVSISAVPEPGSLTMVTAALSVIVLMSRRRLGR
ncbi:MAG: hypothetical protein RI907_108 [Pseudomonadota bacterium]|jgi:hypothetical protein